MQRRALGWAPRAALPPALRPALRPLRATRRSAGRAPSRPAACGRWRRAGAVPSRPDARGRACRAARRRRSGACGARTLRLRGCGARRGGSAGALRPAPAAPGAGRAASDTSPPRPDFATMSESSFSALICSETARRMAVVDSLASSGISMTPFLSSARVRSSSLLIEPAVRRISSVASAKRLVAEFDDLGDGDADLVGRFQRLAFGLLQRLADEVLEGAHDPFEVFRLLDQADGEIFERRLPLQRVFEVALGRAQQVRSAGQQAAVLVELGGDRGHFAQRRRRQFGQPRRVRIDQARRAGEGLRRLFGGRGEALRAAAQAFVDLAEVDRRLLDQLAELRAGRASCGR